MNGALYIIGCVLMIGVAVNCQLKRFPDDFKFGTATAAYQIEGAWNVSDKGENIWDYLSHNNPTVVKDLTTGDDACDSYYHYKRDVEMLKELGVDFYRFSLSWSRILPTGFANKISEDGIQYYNNLINELLANNIEPYVTIYHWDLPQPLQVLGGWTNPLVADYFVDFARVAFDHFGDQVKTWITFNEGLMVCEQGYGGSVDKAPLVDMGPLGAYLCSKTLLLGHAKAYRMYHEDYYPLYQGRVGISENIYWGEPASDSPEDIAATERFKETMLAWFPDPIYKGDFSEKMKEVVMEQSLKEGYTTSRLPSFTEEEKVLLKGTADFFGFNHYSMGLVKDGFPSDRNLVYKDFDLILEKDPSWKMSPSSSWLTVNPEGFRGVLNWIKDRYDNPETIVLENGYGDLSGSSRVDDDRVEFYRLYLDQLLEAIHEDGCNVTGYTAWSLMDNFEWLEGLRTNFGLYEVDHSSPNKERRERKSALVYKEIIRSRVVDYTYEPTNIDINLV